MALRSEVHCLTLRRVQRDAPVLRPGLYTAQSTLNGRGGLGKALALSRNCVDCGIVRKHCNFDLAGRGDREVKSVDGVKDRAKNTALRYARAE